MAICAYCGQDGTTTDDHVPPERFFVLYPPNLEKVPACSRCNTEEASLHEQYVLAYLVTHPPSADHPAARLLLAGQSGIIGSGKKGKAQGSVGRALLRGEKGARLAGTLDTPVWSAPAYSPQGVWVGEQLMHDVPKWRFELVLSKIARGLFYRESGAPLPTNYTVTTHAGIAPAALRDPFYKPLTDGLQRMGMGEFAYSCQYSSGDRATTRWLMVLFESVYAYVTAVGPDHTPPRP